MGKQQRAKGVAAERELKNMLKKSFPEFEKDIHRNWQAQSAEGGLDVNGLPGHPIEVKYVQDFSLPPIWAKLMGDIAALKENDISTICPVIFRKESQKGWTGYVSLYCISPKSLGLSHRDIPNPAWVVRLSYEATVLIIRARLDLPIASD